MEEENGSYEGYIVGCIALMGVAIACGVVSFALIGLSFTIGLP